MLNYTMRDIAGILEGKLKGEGSDLIRQVSTDSRTIAPVPDVLFFALKGVRHDGHDYVNELCRSGVRNFVLQKLPSGKALPGDACVILVKDSLSALQVLASVHRANHRATVLGITGSNGKTVVKEWLFQLLGRERDLVRSPKSYNSQVGVPLSVLMIEEHHEAAVIEAGISEKGEMVRLQRIIDPDIGIMTNIGMAHQENFRNLEEKTREKAGLFTGSHTIIYPSDYELIDKVIREEYPDRELFTWSRSRRASLRILGISAEKSRSHVRFSFGEREMELSVPFTDKASLENVFTCLAVLFCLGTDQDSLQERISSLAPVAMRLELLRGRRSCTLINDSYNSDLQSLSIALDYLNQQNQHAEKRLILSDIFQSGRQQTELYAEVAGLIREKGVTRFTGVGEELSRQQKHFPGDSEFYDSTEAFLAAAGGMQFEHEAILIKGSRKFRFERIVRQLEEKLHCTVLEVDLEALVHNLNVYRSLLQRDTAVMVMVKALSYGSGTWEIASELQYQHADYLCVAYTDEGIALRKAGIRVPVMVMNPEISDAVQLTDHALEPEVYSFRSLQRISDALDSKGTRSLTVHLKLETGMNRLGFQKARLDQLIATLKNHPSLRVGSVFSHLAASDDPAADDYTRKQIREFDEMSRSIQDAFDYPILRHLLNTGGIERFPDGQFDMVRLGIGLYGISNNLEDKLLPVIRLKSLISQIKTVMPGETVGYNLAFRAERETTIGIVPIGYADGLRRELGRGHASVEVNGRQAPITGEVCMDMCMLDLTDIPAEEGDEVVVFGDAAKIRELARSCRTIPYEIMAGISERVKRVYYR